MWPWAGRRHARSVKPLSVGVWRGSLCDKSSCVVLHTTVSRSPLPLHRVWGSKDGCRDGMLGATPVSVIPE